MWIKSFIFIQIGPDSDGHNYQYNYKKDQVPGIERRIRVPKGWTRAIRYGLIYVTMTKLMVVEKMNFVAHWLSTLPLKNGVYYYIPPRMLLPGRLNDVNIYFGVTLDSQGENSK